MSNWEEKVSKYLFFCLDGGICNDMFNFEFLLKLMRINRGIRLTFKEILLKLIISKYKGDNIMSCVSDLNSLKNNTYNHTMICKVIKYYNLKDFMGLESNNLQNELIRHLIDTNGNYELLDALNYHFKYYIDDSELEAKQAYLKTFPDIHNGLTSIYKDEGANIKVVVLVCRILITLCTFDQLGDVVATLINHDIITAIAKRINTFDYSLFQLNFLFLFVISKKIKSLHVTQTIANNKLLLSSLNNALVQSKYHDHPKFILDSFVKFLYNLIASDHVAVQERLYDQIKSNENDNIAYNLTKEFLALQYDFKSDYQDFLKKCQIDEKIYRLFILLLKSHIDIKRYFIYELDFFGILSETKKFESMFNAYNEYCKTFPNQRLEKKFDELKSQEKEKMAEFSHFMRVVFRLFQFAFYLFENNKNAYDEIAKKENFKDFLNIFNAFSITKDGFLIKHTINESPEEFKDFYSAIFSLETIITIDEDNDEIEKLLFKEKK